jgi:hypothetical protein
VRSSLRPRHDGAIRFRGLIVARWRCRSAGVSAADPCRRQGQQRAFGASGIGGALPSYSVVVAQSSLGLALAISFPFEVAPAGEHLRLPAVLKTPLPSRLSPLRGSGLPFPSQRRRSAVVEWAEANSTKCRAKRCPASVEWRFPGLSALISHGKSGGESTFEQMFVVHPTRGQ